MSENKSKVVAVDLDGTLCLEPENFNPYNPDYRNRKPFKQTILKINELYKEGWFVIIYTSRYKEDLFETRAWLNENHVKYHHIELGKLRADLYIDQLAKRPEEL